MSLSQTDEPSEYLQTHASAVVVGGFSRILEEFFPQGDQVRQRFSGLFRYLAPELLYPLVRHRHWLENPFFQLVYVQFVKETLGESASRSHEIASSFLEYARSHLKPHEELPDYFTSDTEFLIYAYIFTLKSRNGQHLLRTLGLGSGLPANLLRMSRVFGKIQTGEKSVVFSAQDQDYLYVSALEQLASLKATWPWFSDLKRLCYLLSEIPGPWKAAGARMDACAHIMEYLTDVGGKKISERSSLQELADQWLASPPPGLRHLNPGELLCYLQEKDLLWFCVKGKSRGASLSKTFAGLTESGYTLTAQAFAHRCQESHKVREVFSASGHPAWQKAWLRVRLQSRPAERAGLLQEVMTLGKAPALVLEFLAGECRDGAEKQQLASWLLKLLEENPMPSERKAVCQILGGLSQEPGVLSALNRIAESDRNREIRDYAGEKLRELSAS